MNFKHGPVATLGSVVYQNAVSKQERRVAKVIQQRVERAHRFGALDIRIHVEKRRRFEHFDPFVTACDRAMLITSARAHMVLRSTP